MSLEIICENGQVDFTTNKFNGGEVNFKITDLHLLAYRAKIKAIINNSDDLIELLQAKDALNRNGVKSVSLQLDYIPYARQDRVCNRGESFSLKIFCDIINNAKFTSVKVLDPHSDVSVALLNNCSVDDNSRFVEVALNETKQNDISLVSPDVGSVKKCEKLALNTKFKKIIHCGKSRDLKTGALSGFKVYDDIEKGENLMIVDDICDGGGTFIGLGKLLKEQGCGKLFLFVTHGIFSRGYEELLEVFDHIYTTDSIKEISHKSVTQYKRGL